MKRRAQVADGDNVTILQTREVRRHRDAVAGVVDERGRAELELNKANSVRRDGGDERAVDAHLEIGVGCGVFDFDLEPSLQAGAVVEALAIINVAGGQTGAAEVAAQTEVLHGRWRRIA